jgi:hypothetical protein
MVVVLCRDQQTFNPALMPSTSRLRAPVLDRFAQEHRSPEESEVLTMSPLMKNLRLNWRAALSWASLSVGGTALLIILSRVFLH